MWGVRKVPNSGHRGYSIAPSAMASMPKPNRNLNRALRMHGRADSPQLGPIVMTGSLAFVRTGPLACLTANPHATSLRPYGLLRAPEVPAWQLEIF